ncbi:MAG: hypothetical protein RLZZ400_326 [Actinomycetota bacterium]
MNPSDCSCGTSVHQHQHHEPTVATGVTRRAVFRGVALIASTLGLSALAQSAEAATKKYTVCKTTDVKLGSAKLFEVAPNKPVLITQPKKGVFRAFSVYCTHSGAVIGLVQGSNLVCQVHGAKFDSTTGAVKQGPATKALTRYTCTVSAGKVIVTL